jgi:hypothetical protein
VLPKEGSRLGNPPFVIPAQAPSYITCFNSAAAMDMDNMEVVVD